jgi:hypothetical protein
METKEIVCLIEKVQELRVALENAKEQCEIALIEIEKLKKDSAADRYMEMFDKLISDLVGEKK